MKLLKFTPIHYLSIALILSIAGKARKAVFFSMALLTCLLYNNLHASNQYNEYWQNFFLKIWESDPFVIKTYVKIESGNHFKNARSVQINQQFIWKESDRLSLGLHYAYVHEHSVIPNSLWHWQHRFEFESNTAFHIANGYFFKTRNRFEVRREQGEPKTLYRLRQRTILAVSFEGKSILKTYTLYNELFYNISVHRVTQNRVCPIQLTFSMADQIDLDVFFMMRFFLTNNFWSKSAVLGTQFNF